MTELTYSQDHPLQVQTVQSAKNEEGQNDTSGISTPLPRVRD